jgi:hypothetical protein
MTKRRTLVFFFCLALVGSIPVHVARAQVMIDMSKVTCADYLAMPPDQARTFSAWMSGYFNQKQGYAWVDLGAYARNIANMKQWCASYPNETVMTGLKWATAKQNQ